LVKNLRQIKELKEFRRDVVTMLESVKDRQDVLLRQALSAHSITMSVAPPKVKKPVKIAEHAHGPSLPPAQPPPITKAPKRKHSLSPLATSPLPVLQGLKGLKKGWFNKL
jgi:hypothetical protein